MCDNMCDNIFDENPFDKILKTNFDLMYLEIKNNESVEITRNYDIINITHLILDVHPDNISKYDKIIVKSNNTIYQSNIQFLLSLIMILLTTNMSFQSI